MHEDVAAEIGAEADVSRRMTSIDGSGSPVSGSVIDSPGGTT